MLSQIQSPHQSCHLHQIYPLVHNHQNTEHLHAIMKSSYLNSLFTPLHCLVSSMSKLHRLTWNSLPAILFPILSLSSACPPVRRSPVHPVSFTASYIPATNKDLYYLQLSSPANSSDHSTHLHCTVDSAVPAICNKHVKLLLPHASICVWHMHW